MANLLIKNLPVGTTGEEFADYLWQNISLAIDPARFRVDKGSLHIGAAQLIPFLNLYLAGRPFKGQKVEFIAYEPNWGKAKVTVDQITVELPDGKGEQAPDEKLNRHGIRKLD
jgi:hypothetical protein